MNQHLSKLKLGLLWMLFVTVGRIIPHPPNVTPLTSLSVLAGSQFKLKYSWLFVLVSLALSDVLLALIQGHSIFGFWTLFTYSGYLMITFCCARVSKIKNKTKSDRFLFLCVCTGLSEIGYWIWTNFGAWLVTSIYPHTLLGLGDCYLAGIPFLRNAMLGSLVWVSVLSMLLYFEPLAGIFHERRDLANIYPRER